MTWQGIDNLFRRAEFNMEKGQWKMASDMLKQIESRISNKNKLPDDLIPRYEKLKFNLSRCRICGAPRFRCCC